VASLWNVVHFSIQGRTILAHWMQTAGFVPAAPEYHSLHIGTVLAAVDHPQLAAGAACEHSRRPQPRLRLAACPCRPRADDCKPGVAACLASEKPQVGTMAPLGVGGNRRDCWLPAESRMPGDAGLRV